jgi:hypothetical protein
MGKSTSNKQRSKLVRRPKKAVDMKLFAGKVKAFQNLDALAYQKKSREE